MNKMREKLLVRVESCATAIWQLQNVLLQLSVDPDNRALAAQAATDLHLLSGNLSGAGVPRVAQVLASAGSELSGGPLPEAKASALCALVETLGRYAQEGDDVLARALEPFGVVLGADEGGTLPEALEVPPSGENLASAQDAEQEDLRLFCAEAREHLGGVEASLLELEQNERPDLVADVFRAVHSIKGGAQFLGLEATATLAHRMEALLDRLRRGDRRPTHDVVGVLLAAADGLSILVRAAEKGEPANVDTVRLQEGIEAILAGPSGREAPAAAPRAVNAARSPENPPVEPPAPTHPEELSDSELFSQEYRTNAEELRALLDRLETVARDPEQKRHLARCLHSLKGIAGFVGLHDMERLASGLDGLLKAVFQHRVEIPLDVKRIASVTLESLDALHEALLTGIPAADVDPIASQLTALKGREEKTSSWGERAPSPGPEDLAASPLKNRFDAVAAALAGGDAERTAAALLELDRTAELHGLDELADAAAAAAGVAANFVVTGGRDLLARLASLLPPAEDLTAPRDEAFPRPAAAAAPSSPFAGDLEHRIVTDDFDQDLVRIFLETSSSRLSLLQQLLQRGETAAACTLLADMSSAAAYMGYDELRGFFDAGRRSLESARPDVLGVSETLKRAAIALEELREKIPAHASADAPGRTGAEVEELGQIFRESARGHLSDLLDGVSALEQGAEPGRIDSINHHLGCLHSAATNMGEDRVVEGVERLQSAIEGAANAGPLPRETIQGLTRQVEALFVACGLVAPTPRVVAPPIAERADDATFSLAEPRPAEPVVRPAAPRAPEPAPVSPEEAETSRALVESQATVRVDTKKIDDLINMVAELVVNRSSFLVLSANVRDVLVRLLDMGRIGQVEARDLRHVLDRYDETTTDLGRVSNQLQEGVMRIRMMPVKTLFSRVPRLVRDLAFREGKEVRITFAGEETELDKTVIEQLSDPLVHLLRNAISHGLESETERAAARKSAEGTLRLSARHEGNMVIIEVEDDGRGIDFEAIRRVLVERGLSSPAEAARLASRDLLAALFQPGFSTSRSVSDVSGRGVGLDVVKRNIEGIGGQIEVFTEPGRLTRFSIRIPLTMAIMQALLVRVGGEVYSIPVSAVIQTVRIGREEIETLEGQEVLNLRGRVIPLVRLGDVFEYRYHAQTGQTNPPAGDDGSIYAVVLQGEGRELAIAADSMIGSQDLVIKSLEDELVEARGVAGAAILGDGTVTLILDVPEIHKMAVDRERYRERRVHDAMRDLERFVRDRATTESVLVN